MTINHQWQLVQRPSGEASTDNFALVSAPIPSPVSYTHLTLPTTPYV